MLISGLSICSIYLCDCFLSQCQTVLITVAFQYSLKPEGMIPLDVFIYFKIVLAIQRLLCFNTNLEVFILPL